MKVIKDIKEAVVVEGSIPHIHYLFMRTDQSFSFDAGLVSKESMRRWDSLVLFVIQ